MAPGESTTTAAGGKYMLFFCWPLVVAFLINFHPGIVVQAVAGWVVSSSAHKPAGQQHGLDRWSNFCDNQNKTKQNKQQ